MCKVAKCILAKKPYSNGKHNIEVKPYITRYTYDGFVMIEYYTTLSILVFHRPILKRNVINIFNSTGLDIKWTDSYIYEISTRIRCNFGYCTIKYDICDWDRNFVAVRNLLTDTLFLRGKDLVYTLLNDKLVTGTDRHPRPQSEAGQSAS